MSWRNARSFQLQQARYWRACLMRATGLTLEESLSLARSQAATPKNVPCKLRLPLPQRGQP